MKPPTAKKAGKQWVVPIRDQPKLKAVLDAVPKGRGGWNNGIDMKTRKSKPAAKSAPPKERLSRGKPARGRISPERRAMRDAIAETDQQMSGGGTLERRTFASRGKGRPPGVTKALIAEATAKGERIAALKMALPPDVEQRLYRLKKDMAATGANKLPAVEALLREHVKSPDDVELLLEEFRTIRVRPL